LRRDAAARDARQLELGPHASELHERDVRARRDEDGIDRHPGPDLFRRAVQDLAHEMDPLVEEDVHNVVGQLRLEHGKRRATYDRPGEHGPAPGRALPAEIAGPAFRARRARIVTKATARPATLQAELAVSRGFVEGRVVLRRKREWEPAPDDGVAQRQLVTP